MTPFLFAIVNNYLEDSKSVVLVDKADWNPDKPSGTTFEDLDNNPLGSNFKQDPDYGNWFHVLDPDMTTNGIKVLLKSKGFEYDEDFAVYAQEIYGIGD
jgi:hypothetical protein